MASSSQPQAEGLDGNHHRAGRYYLEHGTYKLRPRLEPEDVADTSTLGAAKRFGPVSDVPALDLTARAMRRVATRRKRTKIALTKREIKETYMQYRWW